MPRLTHVGREICIVNFLLTNAQSVDFLDLIVYTNNKEVLFMNFYSVRDLRTETKSLWDNLSAGGEVVITNNGKPAALMIDIPADCFDEVVQAVRQAKAMIAFNNMRSKASSRGFMSEEEIEAEIEAARNGE